MRSLAHRIQTLLLLCCGAYGNSCNGPGTEYVYDLDQPIYFVMTEPLAVALDAEGQRLYRAAATHAAMALGTQAEWLSAGAKPSIELANAPVYLTLGTVDCTGDRAGYVRWRPNNVLQICPSMIKERSYLHIASLVMHEMGHVVGASHVRCDGESVLAPDLNCPTESYAKAGKNPDQLLWYSHEDVSAICHHNAGGLCRTR